MEAIKSVITARKRPDFASLSEPSDFTLGAAQTIDAHEVLTNPLISLYCLDLARRSAIFVETPPDVDLSAAPFMYTAQYENALNAISVPYETLIELAGSIAFDSQRLILVYSVARSGSTLMGLALNAVPGIVGYSEPDAFTNLVTVRGWDGKNEAEAGALVEACIKLQCKASPQIPNPAAWAIKFRSYGIELGDLLHESFPAAKSIFCYRSAEPQIVSLWRAFAEPGVDVDTIEYRGAMQDFLAPANPLILKHAQSGLPPETALIISAMLWVRIMECYVDLAERGISGLAIRYEDLTAATREAARAAVAYCGFPDADMQAVYRVLETDSQLGSALSQKNLAGRSYQLDEADRASLLAFLAARPIVQTPDFIVPGTWKRS